MTQTARFTGRVVLDSGAPAYGCRVTLRVGETPHVIAEAFTAASGEFVLHVPPGRMPMGEDAVGGFTLEVIDGTGTVLAKDDDVTARAGQTTRLHYTAGRRALVTLPVALPLLQTHAASIIRPEALAVIEAALGLLAPQGSPTHEQYTRAVMRNLPPSGHVSEMLDLSWAALDGDPRAMSDLREVLAVQSATVRRDMPIILAMRPETEPEARRRPKVQYGKPKETVRVAPKVDPMTTTGRLLATPPKVDTEDDNGASPSVHESAVSTDRLVPVIVATVRIARSDGERIAFFDGLHGLLSGLSTIDRLHRAALDVIQDRRLAPLRALLALLMAEVGDETGMPLPAPGGTSRPVADPNLPDLVDPWWARLQEAVQAAIAALRVSGSADTAYRIEGIEPPDAPPGSKVALRGFGFGDTAAEVVFGGSSPTEPIAWSDERIEVLVPDSARPGPVTLRVLEGVVRVQRKLVEYYREGVGEPFEGGRPQIHAVLADGRAEGAWVRPGEPVAISWTTIAGETGHVEMQVRLHKRGSSPERDLVLFSDGGLPASGSRILAVPDVDEEQDLIVRMRVENAVDVVRRDLTWPVAVAPALSVEGIEVTQGIQRAPGAAGPAVTTIAGKDTLVRVYVSSDRGGFQDDRTTIDRAVLRVGDLALPPLPLPPDEDGVVHPFVAGRPSAIDRSRDDHALVFRVPAPMCQGTRELHVEVGAAGRPPHAPSAEARLTWTWTSVRPVPIRYVRVAGPDGTGRPPSHDAVRFTLLRAFDLLPSPPDDVGPAWMGGLDARSAEEDGRGWSGVLDELSDHHDGSAWEWIASEVTSPPPDDPHLIWIGVTGHLPADQVDADTRTVLAGITTPEAGPHDPTRTAPARAIAHTIAPSTHALDGQRIADVPLDPHWVRTVVDPDHGIHDLSLPPGVAWIGAERWHRLIERM
ncbi:MAG: hypothetical protein H6733_01965 [Alphaproteobacteria bacterium]|nr:hypothetical protein [Alphaproteobacteria bacterium]